MLRVIGYELSWHQFLIDFQSYQIQNSCLRPPKWKIFLQKIQKKCHFPPKSPKKVGKFGSAIQNYWKIEKSAIRNRIHFIKSILVLVTWKNPLNRDFPLFAIKLYRESTYLKIWFFSLFFGSDKIEDGIQNFVYTKETKSDKSQIGSDINGKR